MCTVGTINLDRNTIGVTKNNLAKFNHVSNYTNIILLESYSAAKMIAQSR